MHNYLQMPARVKQAFEACKARLKPELETSGLLAIEQDLFLIRLERYFQDFYEPFARLYGQHPAFETQLVKIFSRVAATYRGRATSLKRLDLEREITPDWFQRESMVGYICYVDLFAGTLPGVCEKLDYLSELGVTYLHLMPLLKPRSGPNDGGYAVEDYGQVDPRLGTMDDLSELAAGLRARGMSLCVDLVVNHTAKEHEWARRAYQGDPEYLDYYLTFDDRRLPDSYERTLPEVFPDFSPGNFTFYPRMGGSGKWVWTTFNEYQWDLNYANPAVFAGMLGYMLDLANRGVDVLRLDAVPFMWKRLGTNCQNQPEVHDILQAFRSLLRMAAPAVIFKAEAIVPPEYLTLYLGTGRHAGKECDLAYNNSLMVQLWSALASRNVNLMTHTLAELPPAPPTATWVTYVRLHDDIGWAITDQDAYAVGLDAYLHRRFLNEYFSGEFAGSFSRGRRFQHNPRTGDARMSGMTASLAGLELALESGDPAALDLAVRRILLLYSVIFSYGGIPLIYMGDELGMLNDHAYLSDPAKAEDNRWMHRPFMDWTQAAARRDPASLTGRIYAGMLQLAAARRATRFLHSAAPVRPVWTGQPAVFGYTRRHPEGVLLALCNFSQDWQRVDASLIRGQGLGPVVRDAVRPGAPALELHGELWLEPYGAVWLVNRSAFFD